MKRTEVLQGLRMMKFEDIYDRTQRRELSQYEASSILGVSERTFRRWRDRFEDEGAQGLYDKRLSLQVDFCSGSPCSGRSHTGCFSDDRPCSIDASQTKPAIPVNQTLFGWNTGKSRSSRLRAIRLLWLLSVVPGTSFLRPGWRILCDFISLRIRYSVHSMPSCMSLWKTRKGPWQSLFSLTTRLSSVASAFCLAKASVAPAACCSSRQVFSCPTDTPGSRDTTVGFSSSSNIRATAQAPNSQVKFCECPFP